MIFKNNLLLLLFISFVNEFGRAASKLQLTVFYESKCRDSKIFVLQQLQPAMQLLHEHIKMQFVPFGKASSIDYGLGGFECQHGQSECYGNMLQDCTLNLMQGRSDLDRLDYVACEMINMQSNNFECVKKMSVDPEKVQRCIEFGKGTSLQLQSEYETALVAPKFIPSITLNGEFDQDSQNSALVDLIGTLCLYLKNSKPCMNHYNRQALSYIFT